MPLIDDLKSQAKDLLSKLGIGAKAEPPVAKPEAPAEPEAEKPSE